MCKKPVSLLSRVEVQTFAGLRPSRPDGRSRYHGGGLPAHPCGAFGLLHLQHRYRNPALTARRQLSPAVPRVRKTAFSKGRWPFRIAGHFLRSRVS